MIFKGKGLTLWQPWAEAVRSFGKDVENRAWATNYRGPLAIHAGGTWEGLSGLLQLTRILGSQRYSKCFLQSRPGHIVAVCILADCLPVSQVSSRWAAGPHCWLLKDVVAIKPVPWRGAQRLWDCEFEYEPQKRPVREDGFKTLFGR